MRVFYITSDKSAELLKARPGDIFFLWKVDNLMMWLATPDSIHRALTKGELELRFEMPSVSKLPFNKSILFSFDGTSKRQGELGCITRLKNDIDDDTIVECLESIHDVLNYKEDKFNAVAFMRIYTRPVQRIESEFIDLKLLKLMPDSTPPSAPLPTMPSETKSSSSDKVTFTEKLIPEQPTHPEQAKTMNFQPETYYFFSYLDQPSREIWLRGYAFGKPVRETLQEIKAKHKSTFSSAFKKFTSEHPDLNIYAHHPQLVPELVAIEPITQKLRTKSQYERLDDMEFLYESLEEHGFKQVSNKMWRARNGKMYVISIRQE